ncbi:IS66 family insertion sequence element accessory protein TnpA [Aquimarina algicola]|uniref:Transposase n=1 Tax=Aquimarina algicola TaxID=2589995 RepID=A0A504JG24_9FLAO|nr:hypothetical protein [Aquimarina algicola]TPN85779.1 hypothetical protein FHK87_10845 [Aquimarina algicola]
MQKEDTKRKREMYTILRNWKKSSLSLKNFGEAQGITYGVMKYWHRKFRAEFPDLKQKGTKSDSSFIPVEVSKPISISKTVFLEIHYPNGVLLKCPSDISNKELKNLITLF